MLFTRQQCLRCSQFSCLMRNQAPWPIVCLYMTMFESMFDLLWGHACVHMRCVGWVDSYSLREFHIFSFVLCFAVRIIHLRRHSACADSA